MHPPLTRDKHPLCGDVIEAFEKCHKENSYNRFFGFCNEQKYALDKCFRAEVRSDRKSRDCRHKYRS